MLIFCFLKYIWMLLLEYLAGFVVGWKKPLLNENANARRIIKNANYRMWLCFMYLGCKLSYTSKSEIFPETKHNKIYFRKRVCSYYFKCSIPIHFSWSCSGSVVSIATAGDEFVICLSLWLLQLYRRNRAAAHGEFQM